MKSVIRFFKLYRMFVKQALKGMMEYKADFFVGISGFLLGQTFNLVFLGIIFSQIPSLKGWDFNQIMFIYGFALIPKGIDHLMFDNLWAIGHNTVRKGEFDKYMTRPIHTLFHVLVETFQIDAFGEILVGIVLLVIAMGRVHLHWDVLKVVLFILVIPFATGIYTAIKIATTALAFWIKASGNITYMFYMVNDFAKYPTTIYNSAIRFTITFIIPFAFTAFYPASYFLTGDNPLFNIGGCMLISVVLLFGSVLFWNRGIRSYESAGS